MRILNISLLFFLVVSKSFSQNDIYGIIKDAKTNKYLPNVNIYIKETYIGTISNKDGYYKLEIPQIPSEIIVSHIGYENEIILIENNGSQELIILLKPLPIQLRKVIVYPDQEDPAVGIMRKVISNKLKWKKELTSYQAKAYTRTKVENETSIVSISESVSKLYWDSEIGLSEEFIAKKSSKRMSYLTELNNGSKNINNFYTDNIYLINHEFMGPTHPEALKYYNFKLIGERNLNNKIVFDILVKPKSKLQPLFSGKIAILDENFAMIEVDLENSGSMSFSTMLKSFKGNYQQKFNNFGKKFWLPIDSRVEELFEVNMGLIAFPEVKLEKISRISNYEINVDVTNEIAKLDTAITSSQNYLRILNNDSAFKNFEKVPLTLREYEAYTNPDTTMTLIKSFPPTGILVPYFKSIENDIEIALIEQSSYSPIQSKFQITPQGWYNRVEGLNFGLKYNNQFYNHYLLSIVGGYQTYPKRLYYDAQIKYIIDKNDKDKYIFARYFYKTDTRYYSEHYSQLFTSILPLLGKDDYFDYFLNNKIIVGLKYGLKNLKSDVIFELISEDNLSIEKNLNCRILSKIFTQRSNPIIDEGTLNSIKLRLVYEEIYNENKMEKTFGEKTDKIELQIENSSSKYLNSDFEFIQFRFLGDYKLKTFFKRRPDYNYLRVGIETCTYIGTLPLQRFSVIDGSIFSYSPFGIFKTLINKPLEGEKKFAIFWEYNFRSIPFEILGLKYFTRNKFEFVVHGASGRTWIDDERLTKLNKIYKPSYRDEFHNELGVSIVIKYKFLSLRLDATQNLNNDKNHIGFSMNFIEMWF